MNWPEVELRLGDLPPRHVNRVASRAATRLLPVVLEGQAHYGGVAAEWHQALTYVLESLDPEPSRFRLLLLAETARLVAADLASESRRRGVGPHREAIEMAAAAVAYAVDARRFPEKSAKLALQSLQASCQGLDPTPELAADLT